MALLGARVGAGGGDVGERAERADVVAAYEASELALIHKEMIERIVSGEAMVDNVTACFGPDTPEDVIDDFVQAMARMDPDRFQGSSRWTSTASGGTGSSGDPITLTYSFVPDGTFIGSGVGEPSGNSDLISWLNGIYGSQANWQPLFDAVFDRWEELSGITFVYEPNDDGSSLFGAGGQLGVRGDIRIGAKLIDGNSGILAYNFFPNNGDMVLDSADSFYNITSNNSRRLRNVVSHENGHGQGQSHVCPILGEKLMEPFINLSFDGPRHDEVRGVQDRYGDPFEPDNSSGAATDLGLIANGSTSTPGTISSPSIPDSSRLSIDANGEQDWFRFSTSSASDITVTVTPLGLSYQDNPQACGGQTANCCSGATVDSLNMANLAVQLVDSDGSTVLATSDGAGFGQFEQIAGYASTSAETLYVRVYETGSVAEPQLYSLSIQIIAPPPPDNFDLLLPLNGATDVPTGPLLDWEDSPGADDYLVEVDDDIAFGSPEVSQVVAPSELDLADGTLAGGVQHYWRVLGQNAFGDTFGTPSISSFTTAVPPPACDGDIDGDGDTDVFDFGLFAPAFGTSLGDPGYLPAADLNSDDIIDVFDFGLFAPDFGCVP